MAILTELLTPGDVFKFEDGAEALYSRDNVTVLSGQNLLIGTVVGKIALGAATSAVKASGANTGNGTLVLDATTPVLANAQAGLYQVRITVAGTNSFTARVYDPTGDSLGDISVSGSGASGTFSDQIKFAITDGGTDFIVGDGFDVTIAAGSNKVAAVAAAGTNGTQVAAGIMFSSTDATLGDARGVMVARDAIYADVKAIWPVGASAAQKAIWAAQLASVGIIPRVGV